jgi:hypothetical protein
MPRLCEPCRFHSADDTLTACPQCGGTVKFTLLPPSDSAPPPVEFGEEAAPPPPSAPLGVTDFFRGKLLWVTLLVVVGLFAAAVGVWALRGDSFEQRVAKVKVGMPMLDAMRIMGDDNKPAKKKPGVHLHFGNGPPAGDPDRFGTFDEPVDVWGEGSVEYEEGLEAVRIDYANGMVTAVVPKKAEGGMRKKYTYN